MDTSLDHLTPEMKPLAMELLARCVEARIPIIIVNTLRTVEEQETEVALGNSWTSHSKHLPQPPSMMSDAIDIAPLKAMGIIDWSDKNPNWVKIIAIGERLGLRSGKNFPKPDLGHFEYVRAAPTEQHA